LILVENASKFQKGGEMEVKLESLIEKIKRDGIEEAQRNADEITRDAKQDAASIVEDAKKEAEKIIADANHQASQLQANAEVAVRQAVRNAELQLRARITALFDRAFKAEVSRALTPDFLQSLILKVVEAWGNDSVVEITLSPDEHEPLQALLSKCLKDELKNSVTIKAHPRISKGFRISLQGEDVYYDLTDEGIATSLNAFLSGSIREIVHSNSDKM
jgi:V/A-type H+/Na+-transporting ATPase subunit E